MGREPVAIKTIVIGAGAAGLCCAGFLARSGVKALVLERGPRPARKVLVTGKGRCNVTNNCTPDVFLKNVRTNSRFLYSASSAFPPEDTMRLFESLGVSLKTERGNRVFPVSDRAEDIADALSRFAGRERIRTDARVSEILMKDGAVCGVRLESSEICAADAVVLATGGMSYPGTGSTGDGYRLAAHLGHTIIPPRAALVPIAAREKWCAELMGLSLKNVTLTLKNAAGKAVFSERGEMLFTHFGVSGPLVLSASSYIKEDPGAYRMEIDLKPALDMQQLDARLLRDFAENKNRDFINALDRLLPRKLIPVAVRLSGVAPEKKVHSVTQAERHAFAALLKAFPVTPKAFAPIEQAVITSGGISVREINPKSMESKLISGFYPIGEVVDVDAFTGGFNLQIAFSTAFLAAAAIAAANNG
ncbi:NAD(P)/FAD-dependent oxidoreductase [Anaerotruncus colihominis]|uniref:NAD(P)/FAD-dependent oxidoreductase n=1 Tax=Anaerotruncus colihominis TaxID=169435 RepID=UPI0026EC85EE|nr:NAD(P)/FAD-dependent oxidoreductase [Anaerotruncus colihominis]